MDAVTALPGVTSVEMRGDSIRLSCSDSDAALRALVSNYPAARDFEVSGAALEDAFLELTADRAEGDAA